MPAAMPTRCRHRDEQRRQSRAEESRSSSSARPRWRALRRHDVVHRRIDAAVEKALADARGEQHQPMAAPSARRAAATAGCPPGRARSPACRSGRWAYACASESASSPPNGTVRKPGDADRRRAEQRRVREIQPQRVVHKGRRPDGHAGRRASAEEEHDAQASAPAALNDDTQRPERATVAPRSCDARRASAHRAATGTE